MMPNTEERLEMYNEIAELKEQLHKHDKAIARIENWCDREPDDREYRKIERATLETVLRIFDEEGVAVTDKREIERRAKNIKLRAVQLKNLVIDLKKSTGVDMREEITEDFKDRLEEKEKEE